MAGLLRNERKYDDYRKAVTQTLGGGRKKMGEVDSDGGEHVCGAVAVFGETVHRLSVAESGEGNDTSIALFRIRSRRRWGLK